MQMERNRDTQQKTMEDAGIGGGVLNFEHGEEHRDPEMMVIQANLDDLNPEISVYVSEALFEAGANDVYWVPIIMKKGRPGLMLNVLVNRERIAEMEKIIFEETTTLGVRYIAAECHRLGRKMVEVATEWGTVSVKAGYREGKLVQFAPEYRECEQIAKRCQVPLKTVYDRVRANFLSRHEQEE